MECGSESSLNRPKGKLVFEKKFPALDESNQYTIYLRSILITYSLPPVYHLSDVFRLFMFPAQLSRSLQLQPTSPSGFPQKLKIMQLKFG